MSQLFAHFWQSLVTLAHSQLFAGGMTLGIAGTIVAAAIAYLRSLPSRLWRLVERQFTVEIEVHSSDAAFDWLRLWLDSLPYARRTRRLTLSARWIGDEQMLTMTPSPGLHFFRYRHHLVMLMRERKEAQDGGPGGLMLVPSETLRLRVFGRSRAILQRLVDDARAMHRDRSRSTPRVVGLAGPQWGAGVEHHARALESVILPDDDLERVVARIREFREAREWYRQMGIPWRLGCLFYGVPGGGKTSAISALAGHFNCDLYVLTLSGVPSDERLMSLLDAVRSNSFVLFEDIDKAVRGRQMLTRAGPAGSTDQGVTFSGLLNALDGVAAREGCVTFLTTNHREHLDGALIRAGRVDLELEFRQATPAQLARLFARFFPDDAERSEEFGRLAAARNFSMADGQKLLLTHRRASREAMRALRETRARLHVAAETVAADA
jgi:mitochondrial chaperone BCS1